MATNGDRNLAIDKWGGAVAAMLHGCFVTP